MKYAFAIITVIGAAGLICSPAQASAIFSVEPSSVDVTAGSTGDSFDVDLTNSGPDSISVAAFSFEVSVTNPAITLTGADFSTTSAAYIFAGDSFDSGNSFPFVTNNTGQTLDASDLTNDGTGITLTSGQSLALGRVLFDVASDALGGSFSVSFTGGTALNNLSDPTETNIPVGTLINGSIDISTVPEPSTAILLGSALSLLGLFRRKR